MKNIIIALLFIASFASSWFIFNHYGASEPAAVIDSEINELTTALAQYELQIKADELSEDAATTAKVNIITRINTITHKVNSVKAITLSQDQQARLAANVLRLKHLLINQQATVAVIENMSYETDVRTSLTDRQGQFDGSQTLYLTMVEGITYLEAAASDILPTYKTNPELDAAIAAVVTEIRQVEALENEI